MRPCAVIPALDAETRVGPIVEGARRHVARVIVVDDGSADGTAEAAERAGAEVARHARNRGKGAALMTGLRRADALGHDVAVTLDADGQHDTAEIPKLLGPPDPRTVVLGVRDLAASGAPLPNRFSNGVSNFFLSQFAGRRLRDTQCGFRRYPVREVLALGARATGFEIEAELLLRAAKAGLPIEEVAISAEYGERRTTHFRIARDVPRIIVSVLGVMMRR